MTYRTILTSKGTTTIPVAIRKKLGLKPGMSLNFSEGKRLGQFMLERSMTIEEVRAMNQLAMKREGTLNLPYKSGDGFRAHVRKKYGQRYI